jgi:hypothetical protein
MMMAGSLVPARDQKRRRRAIQPGAGDVAAMRRAGRTRAGKVRQRMPDSIAVSARAIWTERDSRPEDGRLRDVGCISFDDRCQHARRTRAVADNRQVVTAHRGLPSQNCRAGEGIARQRERCVSRLNQPARQIAASRRWSVGVGIEDDDSGGVHSPGRNHDKEICGDEPEPSACER